MLSFVRKVHARFARVCCVSLRSFARWIPVAVMLVCVHVRCMSRVFGLSLAHECWWRFSVACQQQCAVYSCRWCLSRVRCLFPLVVLLCGLTLVCACAGFSQAAAQAPLRHAAFKSFRIDCIAPHEPQLSTITATRT